MATYVTKKCPHCGYTYQFLQSGEQRTYGCPYSSCIKCGKHYWDKDVVEPALHGFKNSYEDAQSAKRILAIIVCTPLAVWMFVGGVWSLRLGEKIGLFAIAMGLFLVWDIGSHIKGKIEDQKHRDQIVKRQQSEYDASMKRLQDTDYLSALAKIDEQAERLLEERTSDKTEHYAVRPQ